MKSGGKHQYTVLGLMSGTSLDGVDIALCNFSNAEDRLKFTIEKATTYQYSGLWRKKLLSAESCTGLELIMLHKEYGFFLGEIILEFLKDRNSVPDLISSHGHTIFHQPSKKITFQLGDGAAIAAKTGLDVASDFRNLDVALNGQGAPLVPIGDELLFSDYDLCLNLGGFANISYKENNVRKAFDICPVNIVLNHFTQKHFNQEFDKNGNIGKSGNINSSLLEKLNDLDYYKAKPPKSLGKEWVLDYIFPLMEFDDLRVEDKLRTFYEHISIQLANLVNSLTGQNLLITGGGAYNSFLLELLKEKTTKTIVIPENNIIEYKEALIFAFLGLLRLLNQPNCLASVTGANYNNCGGSVFLGLNDKLS